MRAATRVVALLLVLAMATPAHAGNRGVKVAGIIITMIGIALTVTGITLLAVDAAGVDRPNLPHTDYFHAGIGTLVVGQVSMAVGIPLWVIGGRGGGGRRHRAQLMPYVSPTSAGVRLAF
jgi:hypothetical protein